eukprot:CAMPEP_0115765304 /NCGR_PEP_ID=MMETSP0272-20121206/102531_1 /TAXON_ID=71861 /ORGANISM="Scrippsiella trochoidea, Strain CCMP3099" /LENGTH=32 /DNA_ID= /DNA_START= /DNA_END= /DNA_ORIENTATION=
MVHHGISTSDLAIALLAGKIEHAKGTVETAEG